MALIKCPECGNTVSDKAKTCPHCGVEISDVKQGAPNNGNGGGKKNLWMILVPLILIGVGVAIWVPAYQHKKAEELARIEQLRQDSIAAVEAELARLEQLRQDSIEEIKNRLTINLFCETKSKNYNITTLKVMILKNFKTIQQDLESLGFEVSENKSLREEIQGDYYNFKNLTLTREKWNDNITVSLNENKENIVITFPNSELKDYFLESALKDNFRKVSDKKYTNYKKWQEPAYEGSWDCGTKLSVNGNQITISEDGPPFG